MSANHRKLLETAVEPLADNAEMQLAAVALLQKSVGESQLAADAAISRWESVDARRKRLLKWLFVAVLLGFSAWAWTVAGKEALIFSRLIGVSSMYKYENDPDYKKTVDQLNKCLPETLTESERRLLLGDITKSTRVEAMKALWDSAPDDPALYMEYVFSVNENSRRGVPVDFLETVRKLDPENSWPIYAAGALKMRKAIEVVQLTPAEQKAKVVRSWRILDQAKLDECIALFHEASLQPGFDTYQSRLTTLRNGLIPVNDHLSYLTAGKVLWMDHWGNSSHRGLLGSFLSAAAAKSQQLVARNDPEGLLRLIADVDLLNRRWADSEIDGWMNESNYWKLFGETIPRVHASAVALGLKEEAGRLAAMIRMKEMLRERVEEEELSITGLRKQSSMFYSEARRYFVESFYPLGATADLKPGRMADHELLSRGCCLAVWVIFGLGLAGLALYRFRLPRLIRLLAVRIGELLDWRDYAWIIGVGVILPYTFTMVINRFTPLGGRDWSIAGNQFMLPMAQFFGMAVLMFMVPVFVARWRLTRKAAVLGLAGAKSAWGPRAAVCAALLIPVSGWLAPWEQSLLWYSLIVPLGFFLLVFPVLWLLANSLRAIFKSGGLGLLGCGIISRALIPAYATAMLLMVIAAPVHKAAERAWFRRDTTMTAVPGFPAVSPYDYRIAAQIRQEIREVVRSIPSPRSSP